MPLRTRWLLWYSLQCLVNPGREYLSSGVFGVERMVVVGDDRQVGVMPVLPSLHAKSESVPSLRCLRGGRELQAAV